MAVHLCGKIAIEFIHTNDWKPVHDLLGDSWDLFDRIQINIPNTKHFSRNLIFPEDKKIIIQLHAGTEDFYHHYQHLPNVQGFQDSSGGKGISGCNWMEPQCDFFGYAGGINPDMMPFFMTGLIFQKFSQKSDNLHPVLCVVFIIIGYLLGVYANSTVNYYCSIYGNIAVFYLSAFVSIAGYVYISKFFFSKALCYVGQNTLPILLMHKFPIVALQIVCSPLLKRSGILSSITAILIAVFSCVACLLVDILLKRYLPFVYGNYRRIRRLRLDDD